MRLSALFRRGRHSAGPRLLSPRRARRAARHAAEAATALPTVHQRDGLAAVVARHLDPDADTRPFRRPAVSLVKQPRQPVLVRPYLTSPYRGATA